MGKKKTEKPKAKEEDQVKKEQTKKKAPKWVPADYRNVGKPLPEDYRDTKKK